VVGLGYHAENGRSDDRDLGLLEEDWSGVVVMWISLEHAVSETACSFVPAQWIQDLN
jgi:hypothetical protein